MCVKKRDRVIQYAPKIAERDGGWVCHYCHKRLYETYEEMPHAIYRTTAGYQLHVPYEYQQYLAVVDHVIPKSKGGSNALDNLVLACHRCNERKSNKTYDAFLQELEAGKYDD